MRGDYIKAELSSQPFAVLPKTMENIISVLNAGDVARVENVANNSVEYEVVKNVAVISVDGVMYKRDMNGLCMSVASYESIVRAIDSAEVDNTVDTILFRVDTAGGAVAGVDEVQTRITESTKKTITIYENLGASAGIWAFTAADEVYATEPTQLGSIGVIVTFLKSEEDSKQITIVSKNADNKSCGLNGDCEAKIKRTIDQYESIFYARVEASTGFDAEKIKTVFNNGDVIFAKDALEAGFIDGISTFKDILSKSVASMPTGNVAYKIEKSNSQGEDMPESAITQNDLDAVQAQLDEATASLGKATDEKAELTAKLSALGEASLAKVTTLKNIVAMAFEHGVSKETAMAMMDKETVGEAGIVALESIKSAGATDQGDLEDDGGNTKEAEAAVAKAIAERLSV